MIIVGQATTGYHVHEAGDSMEVQVLYQRLFECTWKFTEDEAVRGIRV